MNYFAYGSNMCTERLRRRVPSARPIRIAKLMNHSLRFHKRSKDHSGKCDAYFTGERKDTVWGVIFEIDPIDKPGLDNGEGLRHGYAETHSTVLDSDGNSHSVFMYTAEKTHIDPDLRPYSWYKRFVVEGAHQYSLPAEYIATIESVSDIADRKEDS